MIPAHFPPTAPPPIEYHWCCEHSYQQDELLNNFSSIGAGRQFIQVAKSATQPWRKDKKYIILIDDAEFSIEPPDEKNHRLNKSKMML